MKILKQLGSSISALIGGVAGTALSVIILSLIGKLGDKVNFFSVAAFNNGLNKIGGGTAFNPNVVVGFVITGIFISICAAAGAFLSKK